MSPLLFLSAALAYSPADVSPTRWIDAPEGALDQRPPRSAPELARVTTLADGWRPLLRGAHDGKVAVLVEASLEDPLSAALAVWRTDMEGDGYQVLLQSWAGGDAESLRAHLQGLRDEGLEGAILVGDLPLPWFELANDYPGYDLGHTEDFGDGVGFGYGPATFPTDLFLMDLDGLWIDADGDGVYDFHNGSPPEIWVGRLHLPAAMGDEAEVLNAYLARDHAFRRGALRGNGSALAYVDDDWIEWAGEWAGEIAGGYPEVALVSEADETTREGYLAELEGGLDMMAVFVHSSNSAHFFSQPSGDGQLNLSEVPLASDAMFYDLYACSAGDWSRPTYLAGRYALQTERGLLAVGSTKTGSMLERSGYYAALGQNRSFGAAFHGWWQGVVPYDQSDRVSWYYGLVMAGDPTLRPGWPELAVEPSSLELFADPALGGDLSFTVGNSGVGELIWTAHPEGFAVSPSSGVLAPGEEEELVLTFAPLTDGVPLEGALVLEAQGASNSPLDLPVRYGGWPDPELCFTPDPVVMTPEQRRAETHAYVEVRNCQPGPLRWSVAPREGWLNLIEVSGTELLDGEVGVVHVKIEGVDEPGTATLRFSGDVDADLEVIVDLPERRVCGCSEGGTAGSWAWMALILLGMRRRR
ncbi:MAG: hypothetical protein JXX28_20020 [Deltaproteobacteria bacterium]|nr:hypothetical protein [Deltaproteobacteria bacterium]